MHGICRENVSSFQNCICLLLILRLKTTLVDLSRWDDFFFTLKASGLFFSKMRKRSSYRFVLIIRIEKLVENIAWVKGVGYLLNHVYIQRENILHYVTEKFVYVVHVTEINAETMGCFLARDQSRQKLYLFKRSISNKIGNRTYIGLFFTKKTTAGHWGFVITKYKA